MAYANVQNSGRLTTGTGATLSWTPASAPTLNNLLTGRFAHYNTNAPAAADCHDSSGTPKNFGLSVGTTDASGEGAGIWHLLVPSGLTTPLLNVAVNTFKTGIFDEWSGNDTTTPLDVTGSGTGSATGASITTGANAGLVLAVFNDDQNGAAAPVTGGTSFTSDASGTGGGGTVACSCDRRTASVASAALNDSWTTTTTPSCNVIASFNAAAAAGGGLPFFLQTDLLVGQFQSLAGGFQKRLRAIGTAVRRYAAPHTRALELGFV